MTDMSHGQPSNCRGIKINTHTNITAPSHGATVNRFNLGHNPNQRKPKVLAAACVAALLFAALPVHAQLLGTASGFGVLGATPAVTNTGASIVTGSVGVWPAAAITGFPPGLIAPGTGVLHYGNAVAQQAQTDTTAAYISLAGLVSAPIASALGGQSLTPGVYNAGAANLTGTLTLNGPGLYVFQTTSLTTASGPGASNINLIGGATPCDVWWQVGSSASIGTFSSVQGNILALTSITLDTSANLQGRALARNGTVTLAGATVTACSGGTAPGFLVPPLVLPPTQIDITSAPVPTLSESLMIVLATLLGVVAVGTMSRREK